MVDVTIRSFQLRRSFTAGYRPPVLAEGEPFIQYADQRIIYGGRDGQGRVEVPFAGTGGGGGGPASTDALPEGTSNLYFTQSRARAAISVSGSLAYNPATGVIAYSAPALAAVATSGSASDLGTGTLPAARLPTSGATAGSYGSGTLVPVITVDASGRITSVSTTPVSGGGSGGGPSSTDALPEGTTNLYYTAARARNAVSASGSLTYNASTGVFSYTAPTLAAVATSGSASDLGSGTLPAARLPAFTGDAISAAGTTALTLASTAVTAGSYGSASAVGTFTVDAKGRLTAAASTAIAIPSSAVTDAASANTVSVIVKRDASGNFSANVITASLSGNATTATSAGKLTTARAIAHSGDVTGSANFDGSGDITVPLTLAASGVTAGSYTNANVTIDAKGRVTAASNGSAVPYTTIATSGDLSVTPQSAVTFTGLDAYADIAFDFAAVGHDFSSNQSISFAVSFDGSTFAAANAFTPTISSGGQLIGIARLPNTAGSYTVLESILGTNSAVTGTSVTGTLNPRVINSNSTKIKAVRFTPTSGGNLNKGAISLRAK